MSSTRVLDPAHTRWMRSRGQAVGAGVRLGSVTEVVGRVFAIQSQDRTAAALGIRARGHGLVLNDVHRAVHVDRAVMRGWSMRGTLHTVPGGDYRWLLGLYGPILLTGGARRRRELGIDDALGAQADDVITSVLRAEGTATRAELAPRLARLGVDPTGQAVFHLLRAAALRGLICLGPERFGEQAFVLLDEWLPEHAEGPTGDDAVAELARRYLAAHAPAALEDFAAWSGLPKAAARRAWSALAASGETVPCEVLGQVCAVPAGRAAELDATPGDVRDVRLLPMYDGYLIGYRTRALSVPPDHERDVWPGGGQIRAAVTVDGLAVGTWTRSGRSGKGGAPGVHTDLFDAAPPIAEGLAAEAADVVRFLSR